jgi:hypothetical protein
MAKEQQGLTVLALVTAGGRHESGKPIKKKSEKKPPLFAIVEVSELASRGKRGKKTSSFSTK